MHSAVPMRIAKIGHLVLAAFLLGVLLVADPSLQVGWKYACGVFLILLGAVKITGFLSKDLYRLAFQYDSIYGVLLIGIGLIFLVRPVLTVESTGLLLGIFVFTDGIIKIQVARHARRFGISVLVADLFPCRAGNGRRAVHRHLPDRQRAVSDPLHGCRADRGSHHERLHRAFLGARGGISRNAG